MQMHGVFKVNTEESEYNDSLTTEDLKSFCFYLK